MLSNFQLETHALLQSFLVGQPEFRRTMQSPEMSQLRQRVIAACHIGPMDLEETRGYVEHRLKCVGWNGDPQFLPGAFDAIFQGTGGVPRRINSVCDRLMLSGFLAGKHELDRADVESVTHEIHDETLDADPAPQGEAPQADAAKEVTRRLRPADRNNAQIDSKSLDDATRLLARAQSDPIEERLTRIENRTDAIVGLLQQLLDALRPQPAKKQKP
jgi:hypothetical protein